MFRNSIYCATIVIFVLGCVFTKAHAMVGSSSLETHVNLVKDTPSQQAAARVFDEDLHFTQSGVLISPNIVMTAAHGMELFLKEKYPTRDLGAYILISPKSLNVTFEVHGKKTTYTVECVLLDSRFIRFDPGDQHKFDFAFLKLTQTVQNIEPVSLPEEIELMPDELMHVVTWGNADIPNKIIKRAFYLFEWNLFYPNHDEDALQPYRKIMLSSFFFAPSDNLPKEPLLSDSESVQRRYYALKSWFKNGKKPYGLALPGTSGAPVLVGSALFGVVMGYGNLGEESLVKPDDCQKFAKKPKNVYNKFQTIIATPYRLDTNPEANNTPSKHFILDKKLRETIDAFASGLLYAH